MTNDKPTDDRVEPDGGILEAAGDADASVDANEEIETEVEENDQVNRSLTDLPISRRTTVALMAATGATAFTTGSASATDAEAAPAGQDLIAPGTSSRALELALSSSDQIIDTVGGTLPGDEGRLGDGDSTTPTLSVDSDSAPSLYDTVLDSGGNGTSVSPYRHPQPDPEQEVLPGDMLSEFSVLDRVFTDAYASYSEGDESFFNRDADSLYQAAGNIGDITRDGGLTKSYRETPYVEQFVPLGYTASDGLSRGCVDVTNDNIVINRDEEVNGGETLIYTVGSGDGNTEISTIEVDIGNSNNNNIANQPNRVFVDGNGVDQDDVTQNGSTIEIDVGPGGEDLGLTLSNLSNPFEISLNDTSGATFGVSDLGDVRLFSDAGTLLLTDVPAEVNAGGANLAIPKPGAQFSTDISEVINPQFAVKVDSVGTNQQTVTAAAISPGPNDPITAQDVVDNTGTDPLGGGASPETVLVNTDGTVPDRFADPNVRPFGFAVSYDPTGSGVVISFQDHRQLITLENAGWIAGVTSCSRPRGDRSPCDSFRGVADADNNPVAQTYKTGVESFDGVFGRENTTSGLRDVPQLGLQEEFRSNPAKSDFLAVSVDVAERDAASRDGPAVGIDERPHVLVDEFYEDTDELNADVSTVDVVSAVDIPDMTEVELERLAETADASESFNSIRQTTSRANTNVGIVDAVDNGFLQLPLNPNQSPDFLLEPGDPLRIEPGEGKRNSRIIPRGETSDQDAVGDIATGQANEGGNDAVLTEAEAYRELEIDPTGSIVTDGDDDDGETGVNATTIDPGVVAAIDSDGEFVAPVQILVEGAFRCGKEGGDSSDSVANGTPFDGVLDLQGPGSRTVDITHSDRVSFAVDPTSAPGANEASVTDNGVFIPSSSVQASTVDVIVSLDGVVADTVSIDVLSASDTLSIAGVGDPRLEDLSDASNLLGDPDPYPTGERLQSVFHAEALTSGGTPLNNGDRLDLTHLTAANGDSDVVAFGDEGDEIATPTAANNGIVDLGTPRSIDDETVSVALASGTSFPAGSDTGETATQTYEVNNDYLLAAVGRPCRDEAGEGADTAPSGDPPGVYDMSEGNSIILITTEPISAGDGPDTTNVYESDLQTPGAIRDALQEDINRQTRNQVGVSAFFDPDGHSATGYVVTSNREVASSFDQDVAHSSVEIDNFFPYADGLDDPNDVIDPEYTYGATLDGQCGAPSEIGFGNVDDNEYLERQDIATALGFGGEFNQVDAATVQNGSNGFVDEHRDRSAPLADRYAARCDPLDLVDSVEINRFLGDNELTSNGLELFTTTELVGAEEESQTTPLHNPTVTNSYSVPIATSDPNRHIGDYFATGAPREDISINPRVFTYYDSELNDVKSLDDDTRQTIADGSGDEALTTTVRGGGPNMNEGDLRGFVHNESDLYNEIETDSPGAFDDESAYPRARYRMLIPGSSTVGTGGGELDGVINFILDITEDPEDQPLPFYEAFDILEVGDTVVSDDTAFVPASDNTPSTLTGDDGRQLTPRETTSQNFYGNRFEGLAVANDGTVDVTSIVDDDTLEHSLVVSGVGELEDDVLDNAEVSAFDGASDDGVPVSGPAELLRAAERLTGFGQAGEPVFPTNAPAVIPFRRDVQSDLTVGDQFGLGYTPSSDDTQDIDAFTDDSNNREIYFGEGVDDSAFPDLDRETTDEQTVTDAVILGVDVSLSNDAPLGESLSYGIPPLFDEDSDGDYDEGDTTETQDRGLFVESHDDTGDVFPDDADLVIEQEVGDGGDGLAQYENEDGIVDITGVSEAISDWQNGELSISEVSQVIGAWQSGSGV